MGIIKYFSSGNSYETNPTNPNPYIFLIREVRQYTNCYVSEISYPNCTNFEGTKILITDYDPRYKSSIDPHFYPNSGLIARFEPTTRGKRLAHILAESI